MMGHKKQIDLSVIIPAYNIPEEFLRRCVQSLQQQEGDNLEFIILNDGSTDSHVDHILRDAVKTDQRIIYVDKPNTGVSDTRNEGIRRARGKYLMFVDADDELMVNACQAALNSISREDADVVVMSYRSSKTASTVENVHKTLTDEEKEDLLRRIVAWDTRKYFHKALNVDAPWGKIFRKSIIDRYKIYYPVGLARSQDAIFCLYFYEYAAKIVFDNRFCIYSYNDNMDSVCRRCSDTSVRMLPFILTEVVKFVEAYHPKKRFQRAVGHRALKGLLEADNRYFFHQFCLETLSHRKKRYSQLVNEPIILRSIKKADYADAINFKEKLYLFIQKHRLINLLFFLKRHG